MRFYGQQGLFEVSSVSTICVWDGIKFFAKCKLVGPSGSFTRRRLREDFALSETRFNNRPLIAKRIFTSEKLDNHAKIGVYAAHAICTPKLTYDWAALTLRLVGERLCILAATTTFAQLLSFPRSYTRAQA